MSPLTLGGQPPDPEKNATRHMSVSRAAEDQTRAPILPLDLAAIKAAEDEKVIATLLASLALRGYAAQQLADKSWLLGQWGLSTRPLPDLEAVRDFARRVGALK